MAFRLRFAALLAVMCAAPAWAAPVSSVAQVCAESDATGMPGVWNECLRQRNAGVEAALRQLWPVVQAATPDSDRKRLRARHEAWHAKKIETCAQTRREAERDEGTTLGVPAEILCRYRANLERLAEFQLVLQRDANDP